MREWETLTNPPSILQFTLQMAAVPPPPTPGLCQSKVRSQELHLGLLCGWCGPRHVSREMDQRWSSQDLSWCSCWDASITGISLTLTAHCWLLSSLIYSSMFLAPPMPAFPIPANPLFSHIDFAHRVFRQFTVAENLHLADKYIFFCCRIYSVRIFDVVFMLFHCFVVS